MKTSVVMATYNGGRYLGSQLRSILDGFVVPDEIIVVDDGSTDDTHAILKKYLPAFPSSQLILNHSNSGATSSFVSATLASTGDLVFFADQDDVWSRDKVSTMLEAASSQHSSLKLIFSNGVITDAELHNSDRTIFQTRRRPIQIPNAERLKIDIAANPDIKGCTMAIDGSFAREILRRSDPSFSIYWGHDHWLALFAYGLGKVKALDKILIQHRFHSQNTSRAERFSLFSHRHIHSYIKKAQAQSHDHLVQRYLIAIEHAKSWGDQFDTELMLALQEILSAAEERRSVTKSQWYMRPVKAWAIYRSGKYHRFFNGGATAIRDIFL